MVLSTVLKRNSAGLNAGKTEILEAEDTPMYIF